MYNQYCNKFLTRIGYLINIFLSEKCLAEKKKLTLFFTYHGRFRKKNEIRNPVTLTYFPKRLSREGKTLPVWFFFDNPIKNLVKSCRQILCKVTRRVIVLFSVVTQSILKLFEVKVKCCLQVIPENIFTRTNHKSENTFWK